MNKHVITQTLVAGLTLGSMISTAAEWRLDDADMATVEQGWGEAVAGRDVDGNPIVMGGKSFQHGLGTHAASRMAIKLDGKASSLTATVGISDDQLGKQARVEFIVTGDGKKLWSSGPVVPGVTKALDVPLRGVRDLVLVVTDGGNGMDYDHANWADGVIHHDGEAPRSGGEMISIVTGGWRMDARPGKSGALEWTRAGTKDGRMRAPLRGAVFPGAGEVKYHDAPVQVTHANGDNTLDLVFVSRSATTGTPGIEHSILTLKDRVHPVFIDVHFRAHATTDVIEQWTELRNAGDTPVMVSRLDSAYWTMPDSEDLHLEWYDSRWAGEAAKPQREKLGKGKRELESLGGNRHIEGPVPVFALGFGAPPDEEKSPCMVASLAWSGGMRMVFNRDNNNQFAASTGVRHPGAIRVDAGGSLASPVCVQAFSAAGKGDASRRLHRWMRAHGMRDGGRTRLIDNNSWEGCMFNVSESMVIDMMHGSADLGIELYVLDDGWFGNGADARTGDRSGLGDWQINRERFPNGLGKLIADGKTRGIAFGLWFEPEMVNPRSALFASHPDWVMRLPGRELELQRNQAVLDLANPAVQEFMFHSVHDILAANPGIRFVKWDANSDVNNPWSPYLGKDRQGEWLQKYFDGYYAVLRRLVEQHPGVDFQACSSGGGRADLGAMAYSHTFWVSDNTHPVYRLNAQWNYSTFLAPIAMTCHVTHAGNFTPKFRFDVSMMGQLGMEIDPRKAEPAYQAAAKSGIAAYKDVRDIVQFGDQYRHANPADSPTPSLDYVSPDRARALVLAYHTGSKRDGVDFTTPVAGLDPNKSYTIREINLPAGDAQPRLAKDVPATLRGSEWMARGIRLHFTRPFDSAALVLE